MKLDIYRSVTFIFGSTIGTVLLQFLISPLLIRFLGPEYGDYAFMMSLLAIGTLFLNGGVSDGIRKFVPEHADRDRWVSEIFGFYLRIAGVVTAVIILSIVTIVELNFVQKVLGANFTAYFYLLALLIVTRLFFITTRSMLTGIGREPLSESIYTLQRVLFGIIGVGMAVFGFGVAGVLIGDVVATGLVVLIGAVLIARRVHVGAIFSRTPESFPRQKILRYSSHSVVLSLMFNSLYHIDILILRPIAGTEATAHYKAALVVAEFLWVVPLALQYSLVHVSSSMWVNEKYAGIDRLASRITRYSILLFTLLAIGLVVLAKPFVTVYFGRSYLPAVDPLLLLIPGALGYAVARPLIAIGKGKGDLRVLIYATAGAAIVNLLLNIILIPRYGMMGAAFGTTVGYGSMLIFHLWGATRIGYDPVGDLRISSIVLTICLSFPVIYGLNALIDNTLLALVVIPPTGFLLYAAASIWTGALSRSEIYNIIDQLPIPVPAGVKHLFLDRNSGVKKSRQD